MRLKQLDDENRIVHGFDFGDELLAQNIQRSAYQIICSGHVHEPVSWWARQGGSLVLNPGGADDPTPNHIVIDVKAGQCTWFSRGQTEVIAFTDRIKGR